MIENNRSLNDLIHKYIPQIKFRDLHNNDAFEALYFQVENEKQIFYRLRSKKKVCDTNEILRRWEDSQDVFIQKSNNLRQVYKLWIARRWFALQISNYLPFNFRWIKTFLKALSIYRFKQVCNILLLNVYRADNIFSVFCNRS